MIADQVSDLVSFDQRRIAGVVSDVDQPVSAEFWCDTLNAALGYTVAPLSTDRRGVLTGLIEDSDGVVADDPDIMPFSEGKSVTVAVGRRFSVPPVIKRRALRCLAGGE